MLATSAAFTVVSFFSLRMRPEALSPVKWRLAVWPRRIFPVAVTLKRLRTPRCVFNFIFGFDAFLGIAKILFYIQYCRPQKAAFTESVCDVECAAYCDCCTPAACPVGLGAPAAFFGASS